MTNDEPIQEPASKPAPPAAPTAPAGPRFSPPPVPPPEGRPMASSSLYRMAEEMIGLRESTKNQLRLFERTLREVRDDLFGKFNSHVADQQRAYQQLRGEIHGEKRAALAALNEVLDICVDLEHIVASRPPLDNLDGVKLWADAVEVESRKVRESLARHGIVPYDAVIAAPYDPRIHERVGSMKKEGMGPLLVAEQRERGWASQQPEFVLRRPKVIVSE